MEDELAKHTKKIYTSWRDKKHSLWHRLSEFFIEIVIIVFAVSISIWFHNRSEHTHQQEEVKAFLMGLKQDLNQDIAEMEDDKESYTKQKRIFSYLSDLKIKEMPSADTLEKYEISIRNFSIIIPNDGRFQGFKSSGKIGYIENEDLQNDIMDLYEEDMKALLSSTKLYTDIKLRLFDNIIKLRKRITDSTTSFAAVFKSDEVFNLCISLRNTGEVMERYDSCILMSRKIIGEINKEYN